MIAIKASSCARNAGAPSNGLITSRSGPSSSSLVTATTGDGAAGAGAAAMVGAAAGGGAAIGLWGVVMTDGRLVPGDASGAGLSGLEAGCCLLIETTTRHFPSAAG